MTIDWVKKIADELASARKAKDIGVRTAASEVGVTTSTYCRAENGKPVSSHKFVQLLEWLGYLKEVK